MHYVISDVHCQIDALLLLLAKLNLTPEDEVYFVGDWFDRAYTEDEYLRTLQWMVENLKEGSQFKSVLGNHDVDMILHIENYDSIMEEMNRMFGGYCASSGQRSKASIYYEPLLKILQQFPLYVELNVNDTDYIITHSWLVDSNDIGIGYEGFNKDTVNMRMSIWDREYSWRSCDDECPKDMPIVIHGHTITKYHMKAKDFIGSPYCKIVKLGNHNINIDCGAAMSVVHGGNLAAYRIEDGAEFYSYDNSAYEYMSKLWKEDKQRAYDVNDYELVFMGALNHALFDDVLSVVEKGGFNNEIIDNAVNKVIKMCGHGEYSKEEVAMEYMLYTNRIDNRARFHTNKFWVENKGRILKYCYNY